MNKHAGDPIGIDDMIAAPLLDVVLELALGDAPHRRRPRDAVSRGEIDHEVGRFRHVGAAVDRLARQDAADGQSALTLGVGQAGQALGQRGLDRLGLVGRRRSPAPRGP